LNPPRELPIIALVRARNGLVVLLIVLIVLLLTVPLLLSMAVGFRRPWLGIGSGAVRILARILGLRVEVRGAEHIVSGRTVVYMPNHVSLLDGPLVVAYLRRRVRVIIKKEAFRLPVIGMGMKFIGFVPVDRKGGESGKAVIEKAIRTIRTSGDPFIIFPEGTRSRDGILQRFRRGGFFLAAESGSPIVPVAIQGTRALMPKGSRLIRSGPVRITFLPAVPVAGAAADDLTALMEGVRKPIARILTEEFP
jgi:1-acyl-sn-glycerol-3-phosphate acyltransferase